MNKIICILLIIIFVLTACNYQKSVGKTEIGDNSTAGNIQNGGYVIKYLEDYLFANQDDYQNLYQYDLEKRKIKKISGGHFFYNMNLYENEIFYTSSLPGEIWKISIDGKKKKNLVDEKVENLILYNNHMYYRVSENDDWGKLYRADLNGKNKKLLARKVACFCIYGDLIYYIDINNDVNMLCSMNTDGTNVQSITPSCSNYLIAENDMIIYSDHSREDQLYVYDLNKNNEYCISQDACWNLNCNNEWIFYRNQNDGGSLYCMRFDGKEKRKVINGNISNILIIDEVIIYMNIDNESKIEYVYFR